MSVDKRETHPIRSREIPVVTIVRVVKLLNQSLDDVEINLILHPTDANESTRKILLKATLEEISNA